MTQAMCWVLVGCVAVFVGFGCLAQMVIPPFHLRFQDLTFGERVAERPTAFAVGVVCAGVVVYSAIQFNAARFRRKP